MLTRRLGRTDHASSVAVLGGAAYARSRPEAAAASFAAALGRGVNHLDIAPRYGMAEDLIGPLVPAVRDHLFVACKSTRRNGDGFRAQLEESLTKLGCDSVDLHQLHAVTSLDELDAREGAVRALLAARDEGLCRFVGITGHDLGAPAAHAEAIRRYDLDTVMFPVNARLWGDIGYRRDAEALLELCAARDVGVMAIKAVAARPWADGRPIGDVGDRSATTWYEPYHEPTDIARGVRFTLSVEGVHAFCTPGDERVLAESLQAAEAFTPMDDEEKAEAIAAVAAEPLIFPMAV
jgi:aryl-alcohol dehydrogenase-like predicted oxidoreductase